MRKVIFGGAISLDNYIARPDGSFDWIMWSKESQAIMADYWKTFDAMVMGRKTYEVSLKHTKGKNLHPGMSVYVFSRTLKKSKKSGVEIIDVDAAEFVRELKAGEGKNICVMGGGLLAKPLFDADLIDEIGFNIHPVLLGQGIPLFHEMNHQINLELLECKPFENGCVYVIYRVKH